MDSSNGFGQITICICSKVYFFVLLYNELKILIFVDRNCSVINNVNV